MNILNVKITKNCRGCGSEFSQWMTTLPEDDHCTDCRLLALGRVKIENSVSVSVWWKPWTWLKREIKVVWLASEAKARISRKRERLDN